MYMIFNNNLIIHKQKDEFDVHRKNVNFLMLISKSFNHDGNSSIFNLLAWISSLQVLSYSSPLCFRTFFLHCELSAWSSLRAEDCLNIARLGSVSPDPGDPVLDGAGLWGITMDRKSSAAITRFGPRISWASFRRIVAVSSS